MSNTPAVTLTRLPFHTDSLRLWLLLLVLLATVSHSSKFHPWVDRVIVGHSSGSFHTSPLWIWTMLLFVWCERLSVMDFCSSDQTALASLSQLSRCYCENVSVIKCCFAVQLCYKRFCGCARFHQQRFLSAHWSPQSVFSFQVSVRCLCFILRGEIKCQTCWGQTVGDEWGMMGN